MRERKRQFTKDKDGKKERKKKRNKERHKKRKKKERKKTENQELFSIDEFLNLTLLHCVKKFLQKNSSKKNPPKIFEKQFGPYFHYQPITDKSNLNIHIP